MSLVLETKSDQILSTQNALVELDFLHLNLEAIDFCANAVDLGDSQWTPSIINEDVDEEEDDDEMTSTKRKYDAGRRRRRGRRFRRRWRVRG